MNIFKTAYYLEQLIQRFDMRNFYNDLDERAPKFLEFIQNIGREDVEPNDRRFHYKNWTIADMLIMGNDFYYEINPDYAFKIYKFISRQNTFFEAKYNEIEIGSIAPMGKATVIRLGLPFDLRGPMTVVHEYGHLLNQKYQCGTRDKTTCLNEISSIFFEKLFLYKQLQKGEATKEDVEKISIQRQTDTKYNIKQLLYEREIVKSLGNPVKPISVLKAKFKLNDKDYFNYFKAMQTKEYVLGKKAMEYVIGEITSSALMEDYFKNPDNVLERMKIFLDNSSKITENQAFTILLGDNYEKKLGFSFKEKSKNSAERTK